MIPGLLHRIPPPKDVHRTAADPLSAGLSVTETRNGTKTLEKIPAPSKKRAGNSKLFREGHMDRRICGSDGQAAGKIPHPVGEVVGAVGGQCGDDVVGFLSEDAAPDAAVGRDEGDVAGIQPVDFHRPVGGFRLDLRGLAAGQIDFGVGGSGENADALQFVARTLPFLDRRDRSPADCTSIAVSDALVVSNSTRPTAARASASREAFLFLAVRLRTVKLWSKTDPLSVWRTVSSNWVSDTRMRALALVIRAVPPRTRSRERGALVVSAVSPPRQRMSVSSSAPFLERKAAEESACQA